MPLDSAQEEELVRLGRMKPEERLYQLRDVVTDTAVKPHAGSVAWNAWRRRWIMIVQEDRGPADGKIWYAEADTPSGPWVYARKVVTHDKYTFRRSCAAIRPAARGRPRRILDGRRSGRCPDRARVAESDAGGRPRSGRESALS